MEPVELQRGTPSEQIVRIVQFTDLHHFGFEPDYQTTEDQQGLDMMRVILQRLQPQLVVLSGDIIDGRLVRDYKAALNNVVQPMVENKIPWTYVPGNHDDECMHKWTRQDILDHVYTLPYCASKGQSSFTHDLLIGNLHIYLIDSNACLVNFLEGVPIQMYKSMKEAGTLEGTIEYDYIHDDQIAWYKNAETKGDTAIAFFHIPVPEYHEARILVGSRGEGPCTPAHNSGFFQAVNEKGDIKAMFVGHDHVNDFVGAVAGSDVWLCYGRVSGHTPPTYYDDITQEEEGRVPVRGCRVVEYNSEMKTLSTWVETQTEKVESSVVTKKIAPKA